MRETIEETGGGYGVVGRIARQLGVGTETLRNWVKQEEVDGGARPGTPSEKARQILELEKQNRELRRANDILKSALAFFGAELDRRHSR